MESYPDLSNVKKILVIKLRQLGDVLLSTPLVDNIKRYIPHASIDVYVYKNAAPIFESNKNVDNILTYDRGIKKLGFLKRFLKEITILKKIKNQGYDLVMNLTEGDRGAIVAKVSKAKYKLGYKTEGGLKGKNNFYTHFVKSSGNFRHTVERNLDFLRVLGFNPTYEQRKISFPIEQEIYDKVEKRLNDSGYSFNDYILVHPLAFWPFKCYPAKKMAKVIDLFLKDNHKIIITAGKLDFEKKIMEEIKQNLPKDAFLDLSGLTTIKELAVLINKSKLLLSMDSFPLHIASAFKAKVVSLFGPTSEKNWGPWQNDNATILYKDYVCRPCSHDGCGGSKICDCLQSLSEESVYNACKKIL